MTKCLGIAVILLIGALAQDAVAEDTGPCQNARQYSPPQPGLHVEVPPLVVGRVFGRAIIEAGETVITGKKVTPACLSLFTDDTHRFVATVQVDSRGLFRFRTVTPGKYCLVARSPGLCTGNTRLEVTTSPVDRGRKGIVVHFRIPQIDTCSYADYDTKTDRGDL